jgi:HK97 gp10 family phage protein
VTELVHVKGLSALQAEMDKLPADLEAQVMRLALRSGAKVFADDIRPKIPVTLRSNGSAGLLQASVRVASDSKAGVVSAYVRVGNAKAWWWRWLEFGTAAHEIKPKAHKSLFVAGLFRELVEHPGARPNPVVRTSMDAKAADAVVATGTYLQKRLAGPKLSKSYGTARTTEDIDVG